MTHDRIWWIHATWSPVRAITLGPVVLFRLRPGETQLPEDVVRHEVIHFEQYRELWWVGFLPLYLLDYVRNRLAGWDHFGAYWWIRFEQEAISNDRDPTYLERREPFAWRDYPRKRP